ncbi:hypothetical protein LZ30DRAFT_725199, partial [Colletotrichum cereale]
MFMASRCMECFVHPEKRNRMPMVIVYQKHRKDARRRKPKLTTEERATLWGDRQIRQRGKRVEQGSVRAFHVSPRRATSCLSGCAGVTKMGSRAFKTPASGTGPFKVAVL